MKYLYILPLIYIFSCQNNNQSSTSFKGVNIDSVTISRINEISSNKQNLININIKDQIDKVNTISTSHYVDDYRLVYLETHENCLIGEVQKVYATDSLIFVLDSFVANKLFLYNTDGKFLRQIGQKGEGPMEYLEVTDFYFDESTQQILIFDQFKSLIFYFSIEGEFIESKRLLFRFIEFTKTGDEFVYKNILGNDHIPQIGESSMTIGTDSIPIKYTCLSMLNLDYAGGTLTKLNDGSISYSIPFCDTIYHYKDGVLSAQYAFNIPNKRKLPSNFETISKNDYGNFRKSFPSSKYTYFQGKFLENDYYLQFYIVTNGFTYTFLYNKDIKQIIFGGISSVDPIHDDLLDVLTFREPISMVKNHFVSATPAHIVCEYVENNKGVNKDSILVNNPRILDVEMDDNPVLLIYNYK